MWNLPRPDLSATTRPQLWHRYADLRVTFAAPSASAFARGRRAGGSLRLMDRAHRCRVLPLAERSSDPGQRGHRRHGVGVRRQPVHGPPAQVVGLVADHRHRAGRCARRGSARRGAGSGRRASRSPGARRGAAGCVRDRSPAIPDSSVASRSAASRSVASPGSQCPPSWTHRPTRGCRVSSTCSPGRVEHERRGGEVAGHAGAVAGVGRAGVEEGEQRVLQCTLPLVARLPCRELGGRGGGLTTGTGAHLHTGRARAHRSAVCPGRRGVPERAAAPRRAHHSTSPPAGSRGGRGASGVAGTPTATAPSGSQSSGRSSTSAHDVRREDRRADPARAQPLGGQRHEQRLHGRAAGHGEHRPLARAPGLVGIGVHPVAGAERHDQLRARGAAGRRGASGGRPRPPAARRPRGPRASGRPWRRAGPCAARATQANRNGVLWCGAGAVSATPTARRNAAGSTGASANSRTLRRSSTASRRPSAIASFVPSENRSSSSGRTRSRAVDPSSTGAIPRTTATGIAAELALDQVGRRGHLVGQRHLRDQQLVALGVDRAAVAVQHGQARRPDRGVGLPDPPATAHRVGDDHGDVDPEQLPQRRPQPRRAGVRVGGQQGQLVAAHVRPVDARRGLHDPQLVRDDQRLPAPREHPLGLGVDQLAAAARRGPRDRPAPRPAGPRPWRRSCW